MIPLQFRDEDNGTVTQIERNVVYVYNALECYGKEVDATKVYSVCESCLNKYNFVTLASYCSVNSIKIQKLSKLMWEEFDEYAPFYIKLNNVQYAPEKTLDIIVNNSKDMYYKLNTIDAKTVSIQKQYFQI
jgi:hypothetical protein